MKQDGLYKFRQTLHSLTKTKLDIDFSDNGTFNGTWDNNLSYTVDELRIVIVGFIETDQDYRLENGLRHSYRVPDDIGYDDGAETTL